MNAMIYAEIVTIGDELLIGQTIDTNSAWLGEQLSLLGIHVRYRTAVGDVREDILDALQRAEKRVSLVLISGGLGPTRDDITKEVLCEYFDTHLVMNEQVLALITDFFTQRGLPMLESNISQALLPASCEAITNRRGTAAGMWFVKGQKVFVSLPGVPYEMMGIMEDGLLERIRNQFNPPAILHRTVLTQGVGESFLAEKISAWESRLREDGLSLAYLPSPGMVKLRISAYGIEREKAERMMQQKMNELEVLIGEVIFGYDRDTMALAVARLLKERNQTLSLAESCTGGFLAHLITSNAGSSEYFLGGVVSYTNPVKHHWLGVSQDLLSSVGAVSEEVAIAMAEGTRTATGASWGLSTTGIAGPTSDAQGHPVGSVWVAVAGPQGTKSRHFQFGKSRERNIIMAANSALQALRKEILALEGHH